MSHRGHPVTVAIKLFRRKNAEERQAEYDKLSLKEKLERLPPEPGAVRQRARLLALMSNPVPTPKKVEETPISEGEETEKGQKTPRESNKDTVKKSKKGSK